MGPWSSQLDSDLEEMPHMETLEFMRFPLCQCGPKFRKGKGLLYNSIGFILMQRNEKPYISIKILLCESLPTPIFYTGLFIVAGSTSKALGLFLDLIAEDTWNHSGDDINFQEIPGCMLLTVEYVWLCHMQWCPGSCVRG